MFSRISGLTNSTGKRGGSGGAYLVPPWSSAISRATERTEFRSVRSAVWALRDTSQYNIAVTPYLPVPPFSLTTLSTVSSRVRWLARSTSATVTPCSPNTCTPQ